MRNKQLNFLKIVKSFILFLYKCRKGTVRLRALNLYLYFLTALAAGWGISFYCHSSGYWCIGFSYSAIGWFELAIGLFGTVAFCYWLYKDNKTEFNKYMSEYLTKIEENISQIRGAQIVDAILPFYPFLQFDHLYNSHNVSAFEDIEELRAKRDLIINPEVKSVRVLALSGSGKTFQILKAFKECGNFYDVFYCESVLDRRFRDAIRYIVENRPGATVILDNCPSRVSNSVIEEFGDKLRIVSAYFDPTDRDHSSHIINFSDDAMSTIINRIIGTNSKRPMPDAQKEFILYHCGNIPLMALLLTQAFNENGLYSDIHDEKLMNNLLNIEGEYAEDQRIAMRTIALFQPLDFDGGRSVCAQYIIQSNNFTPIMTSIDRNLLFVKVVDKLYRRGLIEKDSIFINMRPQPLACWLVGEWLHEQGSLIQDLIAELAQQPKSLSKPIVEALGKRLEFMQGNHDAVELFRKLVDVHGGPFCNEDVICSDLGSRLILAMSTVNPVAVVDCLYEVIYSLSIDELKYRLIGNARRNVVNTLEKLCFCQDSFEKAACVLARLAIAENEHWGNNAHGQFLQLFHIALAGTESDFHARINVIRKLYREDITYLPLLLEAMKSAFNTANLVRFGGAEKFGFVEKHDFHPTWGQISDYWNDLYVILSELVEKDAEVTRDVADLICSNTRMIIHSKRPDLLFRFIEFLAPRLDYQWNEMHKALVETRNYEKMTPEIGDQMMFWIEKLTPQDIIGRMKNALYDVYTKAASGRDILEQEESIVQPYVKEFIESRAYLGKELLQLLEDDKGYISGVFAANLAQTMPVEDIPAFCDNVTSYVYKQEKNYYSSFLVIFFTNLPEKRSVWPVAHQWFENAYLSVAIPILAVTDDSSYCQLEFIMREAAKEVIDYSSLRKYLSAIRLNNTTDILDLALRLKKSGADESLLFDYISHYWYLDGFYTDASLLQFYQKTILNYPLTDNDNFNYEFTNRVKDLLEKIYNPDFAKSLNRKLIEFLSFNQSSYHVEEIYEVLLMDKYRNLIWDEFSEALTDLDNRAGFFLNVRYSLGTGFDFGEKSLFAGHIEQMKQLCKDFKYGAFVCAATCPVFDISDEKTGEVNSFHPFVIWLIENFGDRQYVLDEFHSNLNTFIWSGSSIPLIEERKRCFESLRRKSNLPKNVYAWIKLCQNENSTDYQREEKREAYMRLAYGKANNE